MNSKKALNKTRIKRKKRARAKIFGTLERPRLSVFRSNKHTYVQLIDDEAGKTLFGVSTKKLAKDKLKAKKSDLAGKLGELTAKKALEKGIKKAIFDRGNYRYFGRVKTIAESARKHGLQL